MARMLTLISLALLIIGFAGGHALQDPRFSFILYHIGGFGALSLLACVVGFIARKKGYAFWPALSIALSVSILLGVVAAYLVPPAEDGVRPAVCGGSASLVVALIFIIVWTFVKRKNKISLKRLG